MNNMAEKIANFIATILDKFIDLIVWLMIICCILIVFFLSGTIINAIV